MLDSVGCPIVIGCHVRYKGSRIGQVRRKIHEEVIIFPDSKPRTKQAVYVAFKNDGGGYTTVRVRNPKKIQVVIPDGTDGWMAPTVKLHGIEIPSLGKVMVQMGEPIIHKAAGGVVQIEEAKEPEVKKMPDKPMTAGEVFDNLKKMGLGHMSIPKFIKMPK